MSGLRFSIRELLLVTLVVAILLGWGAQTYLRKWPTARERALMQERLEALKKVVEVQEQMRSMGISDNFKSLCDAQDEALAAELELCTTKSERLEALEKNLAAHQLYEKVAFERHDKGAGTAADMLSAKAGRLKAEIALERTKAGR
jgi:outer membrane protein TolC